jgi:hypothetical protein
MLQISEVVNSMKDLIDYSRETGTGPMGKLMICLLFYSTFMNGYCYEIVSCFIRRHQYVVLMMWWQKGHMSVSM